MSVEIEKIEGLTAEVLWTCEACGHTQRLRVTLREPREAVCRECGHTDQVTIEDTPGGM